MRWIAMVVMFSATLAAVGQAAKPIPAPSLFTGTPHAATFSFFSEPPAELIFEKQPGTDFYKVYKLSVSHDWNCAMTSDFKSNIYSDKGYTVGMAQITCVRKDDEPKTKSPTAPHQ